MNLTLQINYRTPFGQTICAIETEESILGWTEKDPLVLNCQGEDFWTCSLPISDFAGEIHYRYAVRTEDGHYLYEAGEPRVLCLKKADKNIVVRDFWQAVDYEKSFETTAFVKALFARPASSAKAPKGNIRIEASFPQVLPSQGIAIIGSCAELGEWDTNRKVALNDANFPIWSLGLDIKSEEIIEYKYVIYDLHSGQVIDIEYGENRKIWGIRKGQTIVQHDRCFRRNIAPFRGAGVAVPVFSLRSATGFGIGEFQDLKPLADWAAKTGMKMIQTLPINDTTLNHTYTDSYPYNAVSVFALHPIYINIEKMGKLPAAELKKYRKQQAELNAKTIADYPVVAKEKAKYFDILYRQDKDAVFSSKQYKDFLAKNEEWLTPYADFMAKRDKKEADYYRFLQFHADKQLADAVAYAHSVGVAMKGDIPIGISPDSVDAYTTPQLFNLDASAGAPPDDFDARGQNWGFPTYNWDEMAKDNFGWWQRRFRKMQDYFDAYRIDHILGFFRIWQMRKCDVWGLCGQFSPAMPYSLQDLWNMGVKLDEDRLTLPYIRSNFLYDVLGEDTEEAKKTFLDSHDGYVYFFREKFNTQKKVEAHFLKLIAKAKTEEQQEHLRRFMNALIGLHCEVLFVRDQKNASLLHPRISIYQSHSFGELYDDQKQVLMGICNDYFFRRHTDFWYGSAMRKLPTLIDATRMLVCGEDLGMVPDCVPAVMNGLKILSLEIQRMPKDPSVAFAHPANAPYLSVCTTGTHDTNPLRAWWEEDRAVTQRFYNEQMGWQGEAPTEMSPEIAEFIVRQHMYSPAMWVILPLQDWLAIDGNLRLADAHGERINLPSNPRHFWCYRMHLSLEDLLAQDAFNEHVRTLTAVR